MREQWVQARLKQLLEEVQSAGGTTFELLAELDSTGEAYRVINELDSVLSAAEDSLEELIKNA